MRSGTQITVSRGVSVRRRTVKVTSSAMTMSVTETISAIRIERESTPASPQVSIFTCAFSYR